MGEVRRSSRKRKTPETFGEFAKAGVVAKSSKKGSKTTTKKVEKKKVEKKKVEKKKVEKKKVEKKKVEKKKVEKKTVEKKDEVPKEKKEAENKAKGEQKDSKVGEKVADTAVQVEACKS